MIWRVSWRADPVARAIADRHYNRQKIGAPQFVPPGRCLVLVTPDAGALWVTSWPFAEYVKHRWGGAWVCSIFRRESGPLASTLIRDAVACTRARFGPPPAEGMVTFVDETRLHEGEALPTRRDGRIRRPGYCFLMAGFVHVGMTEGGLHAFRLAPEDMPPPEAAISVQTDLFGPRPEP